MDRSIARLRASVPPFAAQACACVAAVSTAFAGPVNPDISVIGDTRAAWAESEDEVDLFLEEVEVSITGALNPYASGVFTLGINEEEGIDIEEAKLSLDRYFPGGFGLTAGKVLVDFGQLNQIHAHAYPFIDRPLMHAAFFGEEGIKDTAVRLDWIAPTEGVTIRASAGAVAGSLFLGPEDDRPLDDEGEEEAPDVGATGRLELFAEPSSNTSFLLGGSVMQGTFLPSEDAKALWVGPDFKFRWETGASSALVLNAEAVIGALDDTADAPSVDPNGWFASADWRANKRWNLGGFAESTTERFDDEASVDRYGGFLGFGLLEETTLFRLLGRVTSPEIGDSESEVILQAIFALGPHRAHRY